MLKNVNLMGSKNPGLSSLFCPFLLLLLSSTISKVHAQGMLFDDALNDSQVRMPAYDNGNKTELESLKGVYKVDLRPFCPIPQDQGLISSCTGWASGYGALTILHSMEMNWQGQKELITQNAFSALFIYNQIKKGSCDFGAYMSDAALLLRDKGDALSKDFDKLKNKCDKNPSEEELKEAQQYRIKDFISLYSSTDPGNIKVMRTKASLVQKKPVVIGISLLHNFQTIPKGSEFWYPQIGDTTSHGGHSMVVIGFDDGKEAFEIMNSWGPSWGNNGFIWIKYRDFATYVHYGYIFIPEKDESGFFDFIGSMKMQKPFFPDGETLQFQEIQVRNKGAYYEVGGTVRKGDLLQPLLEEIKRDAYFYAFSLDSKGALRVHWPRDGNLDSQYQGTKESALITIPKIGLGIPDRYGALQLSQPGVEYWCFLIASKPIENLNTYLTALKSNTLPDFAKRLRRVFGSMIVPLDQIRYAEEQIQVEGVMKSDQVIPIIIKIVVNS